MWHRPTTHREGEGACRQVHLPCFLRVAKRPSCGPREAKRLLWGLHGISGPQDSGDGISPLPNTHLEPHNIQDCAARGTENKRGIERENEKGFQCLR